MAEIQRFHKMIIKKKSYVCNKSVNHTIFERYLIPLPDPTSSAALMEVNFKKDDIYILMDIEKEDDFTLYYLVPLSESHHRVPKIFCEDVNSEDVPFTEIFTEIEIERARRINQVLYED